MAERRYTSELEPVSDCDSSFSSDSETKDDILSNQSAPQETGAKRGDKTPLQRALTQGAFRSSDVESTTVKEPSYHTSHVSTRPQSVAVASRTALGQFPRRLGPTRQHSLNSLGLPSSSGYMETMIGGTFTNGWIDYTRIMREADAHSDTSKNNSDGSSNHLDQPGKREQKRSISSPALKTGPHDGAASNLNPDFDAKLDLSKKEARPASRHMASGSDGKRGTGRQDGVEFPNDFGIDSTRRPSITDSTFSYTQDTANESIDGYAEACPDQDGGVGSSPQDFSMPSASGRARLATDESSANSALHGIRQEPKSAAETGYRATSIGDAFAPSQNVSNIGSKDRGESIEEEETSESRAPGSTHGGGNEDGEVMQGEKEVNNVGKPPQSSSNNDDTKTAVTRGTPELLHTDGTGNFTRKGDIRQASQDNGSSWLQAARAIWAKGISCCH